MCTRKKNISLPTLDNWNNLWKMPRQLQETYIKGGRPKMPVKCGKCYECRKERARNWTYKIWLEALNYKENCFITLTYANNRKGQNLNKKELQDFIKRLRKNQNLTNIKYFAAGEYGEKKGRAHYHIIILGWRPKDIKKLHGQYSKKGNPLYTSKTIYDEWKNGRITIQPFAKNEIAYLSLYIGNNEFLDENTNKIAIKKRKKALLELQIKHGIYKKNYNSNKQKYEYIKQFKIKNMDPEAYKTYKKEYNEIMPKYKMKKQQEFNLSSKNMGFNTYIEKKYYLYDLIIDGYTYERPREYLRKIHDNPKDYNDEIIKATKKELLKRQKYAEEEFINIDDIEAVKQMRAEEARQQNENHNMKKLHKKIDSIF